MLQVTPHSIGAPSLFLLFHPILLLPRPLANMLGIQLVAFLGGELKLAVLVRFAPAALAFV
jgi:hypothetical protein